MVNGANVITIHDPNQINYIVKPHGKEPAPNYVMELIGLYQALIFSDAQPGYSRKSHKQML